MQKKVLPTTREVSQSSEMALMDLVRIPLIILVVFIHVLPNKLQPIRFDFSQESLYTLVTELISHGIGIMAVPAFFVISGYFMFYKLQVWDGVSYWTNAKKKLKTLLLPYVLWNALYLLLIWIKVFLFGLLELPIYDYEQELLQKPFYEHFIEPINYPLWYMRDLICMNAILPILYWFIKNLWNKGGIFNIFFFMYWDWRFQ